MKHLFIIIFCITSAVLTAQSELPTGKIEVIKDFEVRLAETSKIKIVPQPVPVDSSIRRYEYKLLAPSPSIEYVTPEIKPLAINPEKKPMYYPFFAKAGYGSPNSFLGQLSYDRVQNESMYWGVDLGFLNANNKKIPLQKFSDTRARINAGYLLNDAIELDGYFDTHFEKVYFYGADPIPSNPDALKRNFNRYDARIQLSKIYTDATNFRYNAFFQYMFDKDNLGSRENALRTGGEIGSAIGNQEFPVGMKIHVDLSKLEHTEEQAINQAFIEPYFNFHIGDLKLDLGGIFLLEEENNEVLPDIEASYSLFNNQLILEAGWMGEVTKNNFHSLSSLNPYISTRIDEINRRIERRIYAGVNGTAGLLKYEVRGLYSGFENMAFFLQDEDAEEQFVPIYDDGSYVGIEGSVSWEILKHVLLRGNVSQRVYTLDHENKPWHMPSLQGDGYLTYTGGNDEYHISFIVHGENGLPYRTVGGTEDHLDPLIDLNLHGDYYITESIGAFVEINNILGNNRERWANYPSYGFNVKGGILYRMP